jgi:phosphonate transport system ATP-binding protein
MLRDLYGTEADELLHDTLAAEPDSVPVPALVSMNLAAA